MTDECSGDAAAVPIRDSTAVTIARMALRHGVEGEAVGGPWAGILAIPRFVTPCELFVSVVLLENDAQYARTAALALSTLRQVALRFR